jgi:hypothetical protein
MACSLFADIYVIKKSALKLNTVMHKENTYQVNLLIENYIAYPRKLPCMDSISAKQSMRTICKGTYDV